MITYSIIIHIVMSLTLIMAAAFILHQEYNVSMTKIMFVLLVMTIVISIGVSNVVIAAT